jgi:hypothetical protein
MYQWVETSSTNNNVTTYNYQQEWRSSIIDSSLFHQPMGHQNPGSMIWESKTETGQHVYFGGFELADSQKA